MKDDDITKVDLDPRNAILKLEKMILTSNR